jgi:hypothetical protein
VDGSDIAHRRLLNLGLTAPRFETAAAVVHWLGAVQSQDYGLAAWAVGQRTGGARDTAVDQAYADGSLLRTHVLRPTWHFVVPADIRWMLELTAPRVHALNAYYYRKLGLDGAVLDHCNTLLAAALRGGNRLTRKQVAAVLDAAGVAADGLRLGYILMHAELCAVICSGGLNGRQHTYALLDERAPPTRRLSREQALAELTLRYFTSHGPATAKDFSWWSSLTAADIKAAVRLVEGRLEQEVVDGVTYWFAVDGSKQPASSPPRAQLLQGYDEYIVGYSQSKYLLHASGAARSLPAGQAVFNGVAVLDTQVAGHWRRTLSRDTVQVELALYAPCDAGESRAWEAAAARHAEFLGRAGSLITTQLG